MSSVEQLPESNLSKIVHEYRLVLARLIASNSVAAGKADFIFQSGNAAWWEVQFGEYVALKLLAAPECPLNEFLSEGVRFLPKF